MSSYGELIRQKADETEIRRFLVDGEQVSVTLRIPDSLRDAAKEEAEMRGMSFSAFVRACIIEELAKKGAQHEKV
jgi:predicted DNA binding CopG/RHH family protein